MQSIDRKSASGFIHGYRYNIRTLFKKTTLVFFFCLAKFFNLVFQHVFFCVLLGYMKSFDLIKRLRFSNFILKVTDNAEYKQQNILFF